MDESIGLAVVAEQPTLSGDRSTDGTTRNTRKSTRRNHGNAADVVVLLGRCEKALHGDVINHIDEATRWFQTESVLMIDIGCLWECEPVGGMVLIRR